MRYRRGRRRATVVATIILAATAVAGAEERIGDSMGLATIEVPAGWDAFERQGVIVLASSTGLRETGPTEGEVFVPFYYLPAMSLFEEWGIGVEAGEPLGPLDLKTLLESMAGASGIADTPADLVEVGGATIAKLHDDAAGFRMWASIPEQGMLAIFMPQASEAELAANLDALHAAVASLRLEVPIEEFYAAFSYEPPR